ncbi:MAG: hypothetical protein JF592_16890 [Microbacterium sp.]|uniref:hypothetical protein n=1 Tax=Microbacterium sp. TaxID=51671 RepID=UPI001DD1EAD8|nr:hypothetical protein [Microbacterium sp.]MBW8764228.1 hypothetical protein [Microbacterium sp.]
MSMNASNPFTLPNGGVRRFGAIGMLITLIATAFIVADTRPAAAANGWILNGGSSTILIATDYVGNGSVSSGATKMYISAGKVSPSGTDWDAVWVPPGSCGRFADAFGSWTVNRIGLSGWWVKIMDVGANASVKSGSCP